MASEGTDNKSIQTNESFNQAVELKKSFNAAVPLAQTIAQTQATDAGTVAANTAQPSNQSSSNE